LRPLPLSSMFVTLSMIDKRFKDPMSEENQVLNE
jgi:hypothetical protein